MFHNASRVINAVLINFICYEKIVFVVHFIFDIKKKKEPKPLSKKVHNKKEKKKDTIQMTTLRPYTDASYLWYIFLKFVFLPTTTGEVHILLCGSNTPFSHVFSAMVLFNKQVM